MKALLITLASIAGIVLLVALATNYLRATSLFFPERFPRGFWDQPSLEPTPEDFVVEPQGGGPSLHGWLFRAEKPDALLVWSHGNAGNITYRADAAAALAARGRISVLLWDYRGFGKSGGTTSEKANYPDVVSVTETAFAALGLPIVAYGESIGGPYAAWSAAESDAVCALILDSSLPSVRAAARAIYSPLRVDLLVYDGLRTSDHATRAAKPTLILHPRHDTILPWSLGERLHREIGGSILVPFESSGHATIAWDERDLWLETVSRFTRGNCGASL